MDVLLDTNFIVACIRSRVDVRRQAEERFGAVRFLAPSLLLKEVENLPLADKKAACTFLEHERVEFFSSKRSVDDALVKEAKALKAGVATLDAGLKKRLKKSGVQVITLSKNKVVFF